MKFVIQRVSEASCKVDGNICEGVKIVYQNKVYDYSIYKSRRKVGS